MKSYSTADVSRLIGLRQRQVRSYARGGFLRPGRGPRNTYRFSFQDLVLLRAAKSLADARISGWRIRRALRGLAQALPAGRALSDVRIQADGKRVVVRDAGKLWQPESGQMLLDFHVLTLAQRAAPIARRHARAARANEADLAAEDWFSLGTELEAVEPQEALDAYRRSLALDPSHADAHVNLGRLLQEQGRVAEAILQYREALRLSPRHATAAFNLGTAFEDQKKLVDAIAAYRQALLFDDRLADAHYNLSRLYEKNGQSQAALRHLRTYRDLIS
jgi:tetratricopeptide (TPR) repeat protein